MKLKTWKDLEKDSADVDVNAKVVESREGRREAIRWVKSKHCRNFATTFDSYLFSNANEAIGAGKFIKYFFNITEKDLK